MIDSIELAAWVVRSRDDPRRRLLRRVGSVRRSQSLAPGATNERTEIGRGGRPTGFAVAGTGRQLDHGDACAHRVDRNDEAPAEDVGEIGDVDGDIATGHVDVVELFEHRNQSLRCALPCTPVRSQALGLPGRTASPCPSKSESRTNAVLMPVCSMKARLT